MPDETTAQETVRRRRRLDTAWVLLLVALALAVAAALFAAYEGVQARQSAESARADAAAAQSLARGGFEFILVSPTTGRAFKFLCLRADDPATGAARAYSCRQAQETPLPRVTPTPSPSGSR